MSHEAEQASRIAAGHAGIAAMPPDVDLQFRLASLRGLRGVPGQSAEEIAGIDAQIEAVEAHVREAEGRDALAALWLALEEERSMRLALGAALDGIFDAFAVIFGEGKATELWNAATIMQTRQAEAETLPPGVRGVADDMAAAVLTSMADAIERSTDVRDRMVPGVATSQ